MLKYNEIIKKLAMLGFISNENEDVYSYGLYLLIGNVMSLLVITSSGILNNNMPESLTFSLIFNIIRTKAGGFHLDSNRACFIISMVYLGLVPIIISKTTIPDALLFLLLSLAILCIGILSPIDTKNRPLSYNAKGLLKRKVIKSLIVTVIIFIIFLYLDMKAFMVSILLSIMTALILLILGIYDNFRRGE